MWMQINSYILWIYMYAKAWEYWTRALKCTNENHQEMNQNFNFILVFPLFFYKSVWSCPHIVESVLNLICFKCCCCDFFSVFVVQCMKIKGIKYNVKFSWFHTAYLISWFKNKSDKYNTMEKDKIVKISFTWSINTYRCSNMCYMEIYTRIYSNFIATQNAERVKEKNWIITKFQ